LTSSPVLPMEMRMCFIFNYLPLTPALPPFGGERESDAQRDQRDAGPIYP
jgi:hypothetical protein